MKRFDFGVGGSVRQELTRRASSVLGVMGSAVPSVDGSFRRLYDDGQVWRGSDG